MENTVKIQNINFQKLKEQKSILVNMIQDWGESEDENQKRDAKEAEGIINLIDSIQDYAVDELGIDETEVFFNSISNKDKLIAEFMGLGSQLHLVEHPETGTYVEPKFNSSWDWLMPVVAEIEKIEGVYDKEEFLLIRDELATARIDTVYQTVVEFIETFKK